MLSTDERLSKVYIPAQPIGAMMPLVAKPIQSIVLGPLPKRLVSQLMQAGVLKPIELAQTIREFRFDWPLAPLHSVEVLIAWMLEHTALQQFDIHSEIHGTVTRYSWGAAAPLEIAASLTSRGYFCHATAASFHELLTYTPETIYINREQSPKPDPTGDLNQESINRAFSNKQRTSRDRYHWGRYRAVIISGKNSGRLGVDDHSVTERTVVETTGLERTLVDLTVRPDYAGGPSQVLEAYRRARSRVSGERLIEILRSLNYRYPYHQAVGLFMQRAEYVQTQLDALRSLGINHDFYVGYAISDREFDPTWRVYFPKNM